MPKAYMADKTFAFTFTLQKEKWDCYHFRSSDGKIGTMAFTKRGKQYVIGLMCAGYLTEEEALRKIAAGDSN